MRTQVILASVLMGIVTLASGPATAKSIRGHHVNRGHASHHHYYSYPRYHWGVHVAYYPGPYYAYPYPYYYPWYPYYAAYGPTYTSPIGYIDTDVWPQKTEVYLDGEYVGIADNFDGFPRHLSAEPGVHTLTFKAEGYRTATRNVRIPRGAIVRFKFKMMEGEGEDPRFPDEPQQQKAEDSTAGRDEAAALEWEESEGPGFVRLKVTPEDASVYLDGEFYAPASTLLALHGNLRMESGSHVIEVVKPGYRPARREIEMSPGDRLTVTINLEREPVR